MCFCELALKEIAEWQENVVFIEYLSSNLGNQTHSWAMKKLKKNFGGKEGMSTGKKKLADRIVCETPQRTQGFASNEFASSSTTVFWGRTGNDGSNASCAFWAY